MKVKETCLSRGCSLQPRKIEAVFGVVQPWYPLGGLAAAMECDRSNSSRQEVEQRANHPKAAQKGFCGIILLKSPASSWCLPSKIESGGPAAKSSVSSIVTS